MKRVLLLLAMQGAAGRGFIRGIARATSFERPWIFETRHSLEPDYTWILAHEMDGCIVEAHDRSLLDILGKTGKPVVNLSSLESAFPTIQYDEHAVGSMAADYFSTRGFRRFSCIYREDRPNERRRMEGFIGWLAAHGLSGTTIKIRSSETRQGLQDYRKSIAESLRALQMPNAIFCTADYIGIWITEVCHEEGIKVPDHVAILGVDNDEILCSLTYPPLSSIAVPQEPAGAYALEILGYLLRGRPLPKLKLLEPLGVVTRQSTDLFATDDPDLAMALRFISERADQPINLPDIFKAIMVSRRSLERRFLHKLGRTPAEEVRRVHLERAKALLVTTDWPIAKIAEKSGFSSAIWMSTVFRKQLNVTPAEFRRRATIQVVR